MSRLFKNYLIANDINVVFMVLNTTFNYNSVAVSFIGGGSQSTQWFSLDYFFGIF
jgi:hypothetical protein